LAQQAEVSHLAQAANQQQILRLDVAVLDGRWSAARHEDMPRAG